MLWWDLAVLYLLYSALMLASVDIQSDINQGPRGSAVE